MSPIKYWNRVQYSLNHTSSIELRAALGAVAIEYRSYILVDWTKAYDNNNRFYIYRSMTGWETWGTFESMQHMRDWIDHINLLAITENEHKINLDI